MDSQMKSDCGGASIGPVKEEGERCSSVEVPSTSTSASLSLSCISGTSVSVPEDRVPVDSKEPAAASSSSSSNMIPVELANAPGGVPRNLENFLPAENVDENHDHEEDELQVPDSVYEEELLFREVQLAIAGITHQIPNMSQLTGEQYIDDAFEQHVFFKRRDDMAFGNGNLGLLFQHRGWKQLSRFAAKWEEWENWRKIRHLMLRGQNQFYLDFQMRMSLSGFLKSSLRNIFPSVRGDDTYDYQCLMEIVRFGALDFRNCKSMLMINVGDSQNIMGRVMRDVVKRRELIFSSILPQGLVMRIGETAFPCPPGYIWNCSLMDAFVASLRMKLGEKPFTGATLIYQKMDNSSDEGREKEFIQSRMIYCTICLAVKTLGIGGALLINLSHLALDGFYIGNMYILTQLFEEVAFKKPVAGLDCSAEVMIMAKGYKGASELLRRRIFDGNVRNVSMTYEHPWFPLSLEAIPKEFVNAAVRAGEQRFDWLIKHNRRNLLLLPHRDNPNLELMRKGMKIRTVNKWLETVGVEEHVYLENEEEQQQE